MLTALSLENILFLSIIVLDININTYIHTYNNENKDIDNDIKEWGKIFWLNWTTSTEIVAWGLSLTVISYSVLFDKEEKNIEIHHVPKSINTTYWKLNRRE